MVAVTETYPSSVNAYNQKGDVQVVPVGAEDNWVDAGDVNAWSGDLLAVARALRLHADVAALANATAGIDGKAFRFTGQDSGGLGEISTTLTTDLNKLFAAAIEKIEQGGDLDGTASANGVFGVGRGLVSLASGAFPTGTLLRLSADGALATFASGSKLAPIGITIDATTAYVDLSGRFLVDGSTLEFDASGILGAIAGIRTPLRNETGGLLSKGTMVAVSGFSGGENRPLVVVADKDDSTKRPAQAVLEADVANNTNFAGLVLGLLEGLNTSAFSVNDQLVLGDAGAVSRPPPDVDPFTGEIQLVGSVVRVDGSNGSIYYTLSSGLLPMTANHLFAAIEISPTGSVSGGEVTRAAGLNVDVAAGSGFVNDDTDVFRVIWNAVTDLALAASDTNFVFVDKNGTVQASTSPPSTGDNIVLADAITAAASILLLSNHQVTLKEGPAGAHQYAMDVIGNVVVSGLTTTKDAIAYRLEVDAGTFYTRNFKVTVPVTDPITFTYWYRDGGGGWTRVAASTLIDKDNWDDGTGTLNSLIAGEWKKDLLFVVFTASGLVEYHVFYGQEVFTSQATAEGGNLPAADSDVISNSVRSGGIVIEGAAAAITSIVDVRPFIGQLGPTTTGVTDHGLLGGLGDADDHPYAVLLDGTRAMTGALDMGANNITNAADIAAVNETLTGNLKRSVATGITAFAGGGQASATPLTKDINEISTVATIGDSVKLLPAAAGLQQLLINTGSKRCDVFPASGDDLGAGVDTAVSLSAGAQVTYTAYDTTNWV